MIRNIFNSSNKYLLNSKKVFLFNNSYRRFSVGKSKNETKIEVVSSEKDSENVLVKIPKEFGQFYEFGITNDLPLYQNFQSLKENTGTHIPLNKLNILLFGGLAVYSFYSSSFQIALLIQLYIFNKFLLKQNRKISEIVYISLLPDMETIYVKTHSMNLKYEIGSLVFEKYVKIGGKTFLVLNDTSSKMSFYLNSDAKFLNRDLIDKIISGECSKVSFEYI